MNGIISLDEAKKMRVLRDLQAVAATSEQRRAAAVIASAPKRQEAQFRCLLSSWFLDSKDAIGREAALRILAEKLRSEGGVR